MEIEKREKVEKKITFETVTRYTEKEILDLIKKDLESKGYKYLNGSAEVGWSYKGNPDWGIPMTPRTFFKGIVVKIDDSEVEEKDRSFR